MDFATPAASAAASAAAASVAAAAVVAVGAPAAAVAATGAAAAVVAERLSHNLFNQFAEDLCSIEDEVCIFSLLIFGKLNLKGCSK